MRQHRYSTMLRWTGNSGAGTTSYDSYRRDFQISSPGKPDLAGSSDPAYRGDPSRYNPEDLLVASLSSCHMLWYLHLCAINNIVVLEYTDAAEGVMSETNGSGAFTRVHLRPRVIIDGAPDPEKAFALHEEAHRECFIAKSVNFPVEVYPEIVHR